ncbi:SDR family oxidoreductase [Frankia sp. Mgl5]|uniref:SDR family oxidoreductase n=1 Tax=Frankia sp. Mgl5 TaxID=2933793 RepID=UPI00200DFBEF|nr:SDR family oxidoreductase [Frankia sp. Mgl5]MCK9928925.1 SDR family oxidoreductase [Frankia sp. Mgl5]
MGILDGKVAVITGAGRGIGKASAAVFVREGARVLAADISGEEKATADEFGPRGIRANVIAPGFTLTEKNREAPANAMRSLGAKAALGRAGEAREQAEVAAFLASDRASFVTGVIVAVDGGWSARLA